MLGKFNIRTDLALEAKESYEEDNVEIRGVRIDEEEDQENEITTTTVVIETENGAKAMGSRWELISQWKHPTCPYRMRTITGRFPKRWQAI